jgi:hypothetical protein
MKILCATTETTNTYNYDINNAIKKEYSNCAIELGIENFWSRSGDYNIIHIHWPEALFNWKKNVDETDLKGLINCLEYWKKKSRIIITRHNLVPHIHNNNTYEKIFEIVFNYADTVVHLGNYSVKEFMEHYPKIQTHHVVIPHPVYANYPNYISRKEATKKLGIPDKKFVIVIFGSIRNMEEKKIILDSFRKVKIKHKILLANRWLYYSERRKRWREYVQYYFSQKYYIKSKEVSEDEIQIYLNASDIVFVPRINVLNSAIPLLAFTFGKTTIGPFFGSIGEILIETGNPVFDPSNISSIIDAILQAKRLTEKGKGEENREYAIQNWNLELIAKKHFELYTLVLSEK